MKLKPHIVPHIDIRDGSGYLALSSAEASLYCGEAFVLRLGRKKKRARGTRYRPPRAFYFFRLLLFWWGYPAGASAEERGSLGSLNTCILSKTFKDPYSGMDKTTDLVTVFDAILTSRQTREKLQCLYENPMSNNFRKKAVLEKIWTVN